jgi:hypothetical protein
MFSATVHPLMASPPGGSGGRPMNFADPAELRSGLTFPDETAKSRQ